MAAMVRRILLVEDEPDILRSLHDLLEMIPDSAVETAPNYAEGRAKAAGAEWDAIVSDERLGDGRGIDILSEVSRTRPRTLLVLMSAFQDFDTMMRGVNVAHIDHFFQKPVDPDEILRWIEQALLERAAGKGDPGRIRPFRRIGTAGERPAFQSELRRL